MNVKITINRDPEITFIDYDPELQRRFEAYMEEHPEAGNVKDPESLYRKFRTSMDEFLSCIAKMYGEESDRPHTVTIKVEGTVKRYPPGTSVNY